VAATRIVAGAFGSQLRAGRLVDGGLALIAFAGTLGMTAHGHASSGAGPALGATIAAVASLPLLVWRRAPVAVFVVTLLASATLMVLGYPGGPPLGATIALYLIATSRDPAHPWNRRLTELVVVLFAIHIGAFAVGHGGEVPALQLALGGLVWALAWFAGDRGRLRRQEIVQLRQRALQAEREAERDRRLALAEERTRIARDLHDSAAHAVNVIAVQAGAARLQLAGDPARSSRALETIEEVARRTVSEIDQIVHGLREPNGSSGRIDPPPTLAALGGLVDEHRSAGLNAEVTTAGRPRPLAPAVDRAAYRILQEALTNCARHGTGNAAVGVAFGPDSLELAVSNPAVENGGPRPSGGHGIIGMRERAAMLGGRLETERADGAFRVRAVLPYGSAT
jgi:signal transduction histidine kinase